MSALRIWRKIAGKTQEQLAAELGENPKTYSAYERGASPIPPEIIAKLRDLGYEGPSDQHAASTPALTRQDLEKALLELRDYLDNRVLRPREPADAKAPVILPEHVQEAWGVLAEAVDKSGADYRFMDRKALGLLVGLTAEEIARKGFSENTRARLLARAEGFVQTYSKHPTP